MVNKQGFISVLLFVSLGFCTTLSNAQSGSSDTVKVQKAVITGYLKDLQAIQFSRLNSPWTFLNLIHNRFDLLYHPFNGWSVHLGLRNRIYYGESVGLLRNNPALFNSSNSYFNLQKVISFGPSYIFHSTFDRASIKYKYRKMEITAGRQRINWGQNLVWNPNDIFNAYSYFNFDYEEKPGADAIRIQYYPKVTSTAELAFKPGRSKDSFIVAGLYRFAFHNYDLQFLTGIFNTDYALGTGWSGSIKGAGFNGEVTSFVPIDHVKITNMEISASTGMNYTFHNSLYLHIAYLYGSSGALTGDSNLRNLLYSQVVSAKRLSPSKHSIFAEAAYQITPLVRGTLSGIVNPYDGSCFVGPFIVISVSNNVQFLLAGQLFFGKKGSIYGEYGRFLFSRLKWSF